MIYPHLSLVANYLSKKDLSKQEQEELNNKLKAIDSKIFFKELNQFEKDFTRSFLDDPIAKKTFDYQRTLELFTKLNTLTLMPEEYGELQSRQLSTEQVTSFLSQNLKRSIVLNDEWEGLIREAYEFYRIARLRDKNFQANLKLDSPAIVITGGFHKDDLTQYLEEKNISYVVISPRITKDDPKHEARYDFLLSGKYYDHERSFLPVAQALKEEGVANLALEGVRIPEMINILDNSLGKDGGINLKKMTAAAKTNNILQIIKSAKSSDDVIPVPAGGITLDNPRQDMMTYKPISGESLGKIKDIVKENYGLVDVTVEPQILEGGFLGKAIGIPSYLIETSKRRLILKFVWWNIDDARYVVEFIQRLRSEGLPVPELLPRKDVVSPVNWADRYLVRIDQYYYALETYLEQGQEILREDATEQQYEEVGALAASIQNAVKEFLPQHANSSKTRYEEYVELKNRFHSLMSRFKSSRNFMDLIILWYALYLKINGQFATYLRSILVFLRKIIPGKI